jgi:hypothetical protein
MWLIPEDAEKPRDGRIKKISDGGDIHEIVSSINKLAQQVKIQYSKEVEEIIIEKSLDTKRIEGLLDSLLDFCFEDEILKIFKKLLKYYFYIDEKASLYYIKAYREMWEEGFI